MDRQQAMSVSFSLPSSSSASEDGGVGCEPHSDSGCEEEDDDERLASLEALRHALHTAPFSCNLHTLLPVPESFDWDSEYPIRPLRCAIRIEEACDENRVLDGLTMDVPKGGIYILLGTGQCGKSTILRAILGSVKLTSGQVEIFKSGACKYRERLSAICVGFMPQNSALHCELTVSETLHHYGRLYQLTIDIIRDRVQHLLKLFALIDAENCEVSSLNSNQKWRLSLAVALIHSPPLLLLDEPTNNLDPLIRESIWKRLQRLCLEDGTTVLATSQMPSNLQYANTAALMRNGHVYEEGTPEELLKKFCCTNYEALFVKFCTRNVPRRVRPSIAPYMAKPPSHHVPSAESSTNSSSTDNSTEDEWTKTSREFRKQQRQQQRIKMCQLENERFSVDASAFEEVNYRYRPPMADWPIGERRRSAYMTPFINVDLKRVLALLLKNFMILRGNWQKISIFYFLFPALQVVLVCSIFGMALHRIPVSVPADSALQDSFGPTFLHSYLDPKIFSVQYTDELKTSLDLVRAGKSWAAVVPWTQRTLNNSSQSCLERFRNSPSAQPFGVQLYLDQSNFLISNQIFYSFIGSMRRFLASHRSSTIVNTIWNDCFRSRTPNEKPEEVLDWIQQKLTESKLNHSAIEIRQVIYGSTDFRFLSFILPGFLMCFVFTYSLVLSAFLFFRETVSGLAERSLISGASGLEILFAHCLSMSVLLVIQLSILLFIVFTMFGLPSECPFISLWSLIFLQGHLGHMFGQFIAVMCPKPKMAFLITTALIIPGFFFSGIVWPIESMDPIAQRFANILPLTHPVNALRYILSRGADMHFGPIVAGFIVPATYMAVLGLLTTLTFKFKTRT